VRHIRSGEQPGIGDGHEFRRLPLSDSSRNPTVSHHRPTVDSNVSGSHVATDTATIWSPVSQTMPLDTRADSVYPVLSLFLFGEDSAESVST
jgi:hypothetical protein